MDTKEKEVEEAKFRLKMRDIVRIPNKGREGLGITERKYYKNSKKKERRDMIVSTVREKEEEKRVAKIVSLAQQGASYKWDVPQRNLSHSEMLHMPEGKFKFLLKN